jgi:hypothetical protein
MPTEPARFPRQEDGATAIEYGGHRGPVLGRDRRRPDRRERQLRHPVQPRLERAVRCGRRVTCEVLSLRLLGSAGLEGPLRGPMAERYPCDRTASRLMAGIRGSSENALCGWSAGCARGGQTLKSAMRAAVDGPAGLVGP